MTPVRWTWLAMVMACTPASEHGDPWAASARPVTRAQRGAKLTRVREEHPMSDPNPSTLLLADFLALRMCVASLARETLLAEGPKALARAKSKARSGRPRRRIHTNAIQTP